MASSRPFSEEIIAGPRACSMRATWPSGICAPLGAATSTLAERLRVGAVLRRVAHAHREPPPAFDGRRQVRLADRGLDDLLDVADADAVARRRGAIDLDVQVLAAGDLLGIDIAGAGHRPQHLGHLPRERSRARSGRCRRS